MNTAQAINPDWSKIANAADLPSAELARILIQQVLAMAVMFASEGHQVNLNLKVGQLTLSDDKVKFTSQKMGNR